MKSFIYTIILACLTAGMYAQESDSEVRTIFGGKKNRHNGGYGAIMVNYSQIIDRDAILIGGRGAWVVDHGFGLGLGGYGFMTDPQMDPIKGEEYQVSGGYGGLLLEPIVGAKSPIHLSFPILIGAGGVAYNKHWQEYEEDQSDKETYEDSDAFFVFEPGVELEFNMVKFFRLGLTVTYRYTSEIQLSYKEGTPDAPNPNVIGSTDMLRGFNYGIVLKFGKF